MARPITNVAKLQAANKQLLYSVCELETNVNNLTNSLNNANNRIADLESCTDDKMDSLDVEPIAVQSGKPLHIEFGGLQLEQFVTDTSRVLFNVTTEGYNLTFSNQE